MKYLKEVEIWRILILNTFMGLIMSGPFTLSLMIIDGFNEVGIDSRLIGVCMLLAVTSSILASNYILWKVSKKQNIRRKNIGNMLAIKTTSVAMTLGITIGSYFTMNPIWKAINSWWH